MTNKDERKKTLLKPNINKVIEGRSVIIKPITEKEINQKYVNWLNNPEVNKYLEVRHKKQSIDNIYDYINGLRSVKGCEVMAIFTKNNNHVGNIAITDFNTNNLTSIYGIMIGDEKAKRIGMGGEATLLFLEYIFNSTNIRRFYEGVIRGNNEAQKVLESLGFQKEGVLRKHHILKDGKIEDQIQYGILREEWGRNKIKFKNILKFMKVYNIDQYEKY